MPCTAKDLALPPLINKYSFRKVEVIVKELLLFMFMFSSLCEPQQQPKEKSEILYSVILTIKARKIIIILSKNENREIS